MEDGIPLSDLGNQVGAAHGGMGENICDGKVTFYWRSWGDMIKYSILTIPKFEVPAGCVGGATPCMVAKGGEVWSGLYDRAWPNFPMLDSLDAPGKHNIIKSLCAAMGNV